MHMSKNTKSMSLVIRKGDDDQEKESSKSEKKADSKYLRIHKQELKELEERTEEEVEELYRLLLEGKEKSIFPLW